MSYIVSEIWIGERFLEDEFYYYSQQIISAVANESLGSLQKPYKKRTRNTEPLML